MEVVDWLLDSDPAIRFQTMRDLLDASASEVANERARIPRALDHFRAAGARPDARMNDAVRNLESKRQQDGRWLLDRTHDEALCFPFPEKVGEPSRWNTLRALRVLRWHKGEGPETEGPRATMPRK